MSTPRGPARLAVLISTSVLPAGRIRDRYRQELVADLHALDRSKQLQFAAGVVSRAWSLRRAVIKENAMEIGRAHARKPPLHCRLHLYHHHRKVSTEDGQVYATCVDCGHIDNNYVDPEGPGLISRGLPM
jgi:hypothetical protein